MAISDTDLLLVQRGNVPYKATADQLATYSNSKIELGNSKDIPIASTSQLGVIKVGTNLEIDAGGTLSAVIPSGTEYMGKWTDADNPPTATSNGQFWIWEGGDATLNNPLWGADNGETVSNNDRLLYNGSTFDLLPAGSGGGLVEITATAPVEVTAVSDGEQDVFMKPATKDQDGYMPKEAFAQLDNLVTNPGGISSLLAGDNITVLVTSPGSPATPQVSVTPNSFIPYDISLLTALPG